MSSPGADVLIVGAGSAGSVLAERLSADPDCHVVVLEAGPGFDDTAVGELTGNGVQLPIGAASPLVRSYETILTEAPVRTAAVMRGRVVGGSGAVNGGYFCRGLPADFDGWNLPGWTWADVLPHFRAIERDLDFGAHHLHGDRGPIDVRRTAEISSSSAYFVDSAIRAGLGWIDDLNGFTDAGASVAGVGAIPLNIVDGVRQGPGRAVLAPARTRPNLSIVAGATARRIRFSAGRAVGVELLDQESTVIAADRVVLSAGAIGSAQLLLLSGVGPANASRLLGIDVVADLPVGQGFGDHPEWVLPTQWPVLPNRPVVEVVVTTEEGHEIRPYTGGFIAMTGGRAHGRPDWPHLGVALMRPSGRGALELVSSDPTVAPRLRHRYDADPADSAALRRGADLAAQLARTSTAVGEPAWSTTQHLCGTAPMGAVLDERCAVRGVDGLWVVDGSALPQITTRGPHATIVMMAHRAVEFIVRQA